MKHIVRVDVTYVENDGILNKVVGTFEISETEFKNANVDWDVLLTDRLVYKLKQWFEEHE